jgi:predicted MFS family arabinose efflux permease
MANPVSDICTGSQSTSFNGAMKIVLNLLLVYHECHRFGRRLALKVSLTVKLTGTAMALLANDYVTFVIGRVVTDIGSCGTGLTAFVIGKSLVISKRINALDHINTVAGFRE